MAGTVKVVPNQSMLDVVIQGTGSLEAAMQFCSDNNVSLSDIPAVDTVYVVSDAALALGDSSVLQTLRQRGITIGTLALPGPAAPLGYTIMLYPIMTASAVDTSLGHPSILGYWAIVLSASTTGLAANAFAAIPYQSDPNPMAYGVESVVVAGTAMGSKNSEGPVVQGTTFTGGAMTVVWHIPYDVKSTGTGVVFVQSAIFSGGTEHTLQLLDVNGNAAIVSPLIVLKNNNQQVVDSLLPTINVELVGTGPTSVVLRVIRNHPAITNPDYANVSLTFTDEASGGVPDPDDPANPDKCIITLAAGKHTIGVKAQYLYSDLVHVVGNSMIQMVIKIS